MIRQNRMKVSWFYVLADKQKSLKDFETHTTNLQMFFVFWHENEENKNRFPKKLQIT